MPAAKLPISIRSFAVARSLEPASKSGGGGRGGRRSMHTSTYAAKRIEDAAKYVKHTFAASSIGGRTTACERARRQGDLTSRTLQGVTRGNRCSEYRRSCRSRSC